MPDVAGVGTSQASHASIAPTDFSLHYIFTTPLVLGMSKHKPTICKSRVFHILKIFI
jgi:hypothetical protein